MLPQGPRRPRAALRRRARRLEGLRQARRHREPAATVDRLLIGGGMCFTFLAAQGHGVGSSLLEADQIETVQGPPRDGRGAAASSSSCRSTSSSPTAFSADAEHKVVAADAIPDGWMGLDIGPDSRELFAARARRRPHGRLERPDGRVRDGAVRRGHPRGRRGDRRTSTGFTVVGGGDSAAAVRLLGIDEAGFSPHLHRWRCVAWSSSRASACPASRSWRTEPWLEPHSRSWRATGR